MLFSGLVPWLRPYADEIMRLGGSRIVLTSVRRTRRQQTDLYRRYLQGLSKYPAAPPGTSEHELGLAFDIYGPDAVLKRLGEIWESWGGVWGGRFGDNIHFGVKRK